MIITNHLFRNNLSESYRDLGLHYAKVGLITTPWLITI
jgi:hypothetical protein